MRAFSNALKPHSYGDSFSALGRFGPQHVADHDQGDADAGGDDQEQQGRQVFGQHARAFVLSGGQPASRPLAYP